VVYDKTMGSQGTTVSVSDSE